MSERGDPLSRMTWLMCQTVLKHVLLMKAKRSTLEMKYFVKERKAPLLIMTWVMSQWWWTRRTLTSEFQDNHIPLWSMRKVPAFENWFRKLRTIQIDMLFNKIYDRINHLILSVQNQNTWFRMWVTSNYVNCLRRSPKRSAKHAYHIGISALSIARAGDLMDIDMECQETKNIRLTNWRRNAKREISKESMTDSNEIKNSVFEWLQIIEMKNFVDDGMLLRMTITLTIWQHKNTSTIRTNGGFTQISKVLTLCHWGIDLISSNHCLSCNDCNKKQEKNHMSVLTLKHKQWETRSSSSTWWNWQGSWWTPYHSESQEGDEPSIEWTGRPVACSIWQAASKLTFTNSMYFVTVGSFTADGGQL